MYIVTTARNEYWFGRRIFIIAVHMSDAYGRPHYKYQSPGSMA